VYIGDYYFKTPCRPEQLLGQPGVYAIVGPVEALLDVGQSDNVRARIQSHERVGCWNRHAPLGWLVAVHYTPDPEKRTLIERHIRQTRSLPCGER
jgi:hypothetical protein